MSTIRRQSIISSVLIYIGFAFGALNTYLFTREGIFTPEQYGLTRAFIVMGNFFFGFASLAIPSMIYKFAPYYQDNLEPRKNDLFSLALVLGGIGFVLTAAGVVLFEPLVIQKFSAKSPLLVQYYYWIVPFLFFLLFFSILEAYAWSLKKTILPNFLREAGFRVTTTLLIIFFILTGRNNFALFIKLFSLLYGISFVALLWYLVASKQVHFTFSISRVTKKFWKKMASLMSFVMAGSVVYISAQSIDSFTIASYVDLTFLAVFDFSSYISTVIQVPQRSIISISIAYLSKAWKDKDFGTIQRIYTRSSLNLLLASLFIFGLIWLNFDNAIETFNLNPVYRAGKWVVFIMGIKYIIDMGTGVNAQIIGTSVHWRFEFLSGVILLACAIPLTIVLVKQFQIIGAALSNLIAFTLYNLIRLGFLWFKFKLQPFSRNTLVTLAMAAACYGVTYIIFGRLTGLAGLFINSIVFTGLYAAGTFYLDISPDLKPVLQTIKRRLGWKG